MSEIDDFGNGNNDGDRNGLGNGTMSSRGNDGRGNGRAQGAGDRPRRGIDALSHAERNIIDRLGELSEFEEVSADEVKDRKRKIEAERDVQSGVSVRAAYEAREAATKNAMQQGMSSLERMVQGVKNFITGGIEKEYQGALKSAEQRSAELEIMSNNSKTIISGYSIKLMQAQKKRMLDVQEFALNNILSMQYERSHADLSSRIEEAQREVSFGSGITSEIMELQTQLSDLEGKMIEINGENNELAINIEVADEEINNYRTIITKVRKNLRSYEEQRIKFDGHVKLAATKRDIMQGLKGNKSARDMYEHASVLLEDIKGFENKMKVDDEEPLDPRYKIDRPGKDTQKVEGQEYWMERAPKILGYERNKGKKD